MDDDDRPYMMYIACTVLVVFVHIQLVQNVVDRL